MFEETRYYIAKNDVLKDLYAQGMSQEEVDEAYERMMAFEKQHARYLFNYEKYISDGYGAFAQAVENCIITPDELFDACSNFPMKALLDKLGMGNSKVYFASEGWPKAFDELWVDENIEVIKEIAKFKILNETRPYRDQTVYYGEAGPDAKTNAFKACDSLDTFAIVLAETYVKEGIGTKAIERLTDLAEEIIKTYKDLVSETSWISEGSKARIIEKLDHITINMLEPAEGYYDFSGLELVPTEEGGTLFDNYLKLKQYRLDQESRMVSKSATHAAVWHAQKPTVMNASYEPSANSINIYPGYISSLNYTDDMSEAELLAGLGFAIGHEISHGFDYLGSQYDAYGTPTPVFEDDDLDAFESRTFVLAEYYDSIEIAPGVMVDGSNVVTEAASDLSGLQVVLEIAGKNENIKYENVFVMIAETWAEVNSEEKMDYILLDPHPLSNLRVNVNAQLWRRKLPRHL